MRKLLALITTLLVGAGLIACGDENGEGGGFSFAGKDPISIVAATELKDLEPLVQRASEDLGFDIHLEFPDGTLANSQSLKSGNFDNQYDATWFATDRYVELIAAAGKLQDSTKIATSPVAFGVREDKARELGWDSKQPTWSEFAEAAKEGKFTFGMTDPSSSNSGLSALASVATALADTGQALTQDDVEKVGSQLHDLFQAQTMVSGSSGWLAESFQDNPGKADAIINYESTLHSLREAGADIQVVVPADGVISADYPLSTLAHPKNPDAREQVRALADWLLEHQEEITDSFRRPVRDAAPREEVAAQTVIELPFPGSFPTVVSLIDRYNNDYRQRGTTTFVLDASGSMEGQRLLALRDTMLSLIDGSASTSTGDVSLRDGEKVTLQAFNTTPLLPLDAEFSRDDDQVKNRYESYIKGIRPGGHTAIYDTLLQAINNTDTRDGINTIVLLSDGEVTEGLDYYGFEAAYRELPADKKAIPVFVILYGEASVSEMEDLAELTGGAVFDAINGDLDEAFKEIRGYQ